MSKKLVELKPCPFCGGKAVRVKRDKVYFGESYYVQCNNIKCNVRPCTSAYDRLCDATQVWNRRAKDE